MPVGILDDIAYQLGKIFTGCRPFRDNSAHNILVDYLGF